MAAKKESGGLQFVPEKPAEEVLKDALNRACEAAGRPQAFPAGKELQFVPEDMTELRRIHEKVQDEIRQEDKERKEQFADMLRGLAQERQTDDAPHCRTPGEDSRDAEITTAAAAAAAIAFF